MTTQPKYTFLLPAYKTKYLEEALRSIKAQSFQDFRVLVSDDCSPEPLKPIFDRVCGDDPRFTFRRNAENMGGKSLVAHWNLLVDMCETDFVIMASDDDVYEPGFLEEIDRMTEQYPQASLFRAGMRYIDENGKTLLKDGRTASFLDQAHFLLHYNSGLLLYCEANYCYRTEALKANSGYADFPLAWFSDDATHLAVAKNGCALSDKILFNFRRSAESITGAALNPDVCSKKSESALAFYSWLKQHRSDFASEQEPMLCSLAMATCKRKVENEIRNNILFCRYSDFRRILKACQTEFNWSSVALHYLWLHAHLR